MAVTFDDLPVHGAMPPGMTRLEITQSILKTLKREKLPAVYGFINGGRGADDPSSLSVLRAWRQAGQPLGNHTWAHLDLNKETAEQFEAEVLRNEALLQSLMGYGDWHWLRYPFLHEGDTVEKRRAVRSWLAAHGYKIAEVSMDFEDYLWNEPYARCMAMHDEASIAKLRDSYLAVADQYYGVFRELSHLVYGRDVKYVPADARGSVRCTHVAGASAAVPCEGREIHQFAECTVRSCIPGRSGHRRAVRRGVLGTDDAREEAQVPGEL
jgi:peptidoglycan-N-acetylglucosamine deacetylase